MPRHPNHERSIMTVIGRPEGLRCGQDLSDILLNLNQIESEEFLSIIERWIRIVSFTLVQYLEVELIRPPFLIGDCSLGAHVWARGSSIISGSHGNAASCGVQGLDVNNLCHILMCIVISFWIPRCIRVRIEVSPLFCRRILTIEQYQYHS